MNQTRKHPAKPRSGAAAGGPDAKPRGTLFVVATPIGNLEDITLRALRVLKEADVIACEDTRQTQKLLNHFDISKRTLSYHDFNERERAEELVLELEGGAQVALVSDAGMPGIADPGYRLVGAAIARGIAVVPIPGASAMVAALAASGLPTDEFHFAGFLPAKAGQRRTRLERLRESPATEIFYEAPHRLLETLRDIVEVLGPEREIVIARELTKLHEEFVRGSAQDALAHFEERPARGEVTLLIGKAETGGRSGSSAAPAMSLLHENLRELMQQEDLDQNAALKRLAKQTGKPKSELYRELQRLKTTAPADSRRRGGKR